MSDKPKIYCYTHANDGEPGEAFALTEDGTVLATEWCGIEIQVPYKLGVIKGEVPTMHDKKYDAYYPDGYELEYVKTRDLGRHEGFKKAKELHNAKRKRAANDHH